jgi:N-acetyl-alpha-D-muramate 1-phosphate uridylyltransferase
MIFAAGLGTRLMPLTQNTPKAMVMVNNRPLLWYAIQNVLRAGATRIVVNVHHFSHQIIQYLNSEPFSGCDIVVSNESNELLETGGGLLHAADLFLKNKPILIHNADVLTNCDLTQLVKFHYSQNGLATLMVQHRQTSRFLLFDQSDCLKGWYNSHTGESKLTDYPNAFKQLAFNGIQIVNYDLLNLLGTIRKFSITDGYLSICQNYNIIAWHHWQGQWFDIGTIEKLELANEAVNSNQFSFFQTG